MIKVSNKMKVKNKNLTILHQEFIICLEVLDKFSAQFMAQQYQKNLATGLVVIKLL